MWLRWSLSLRSRKQENPNMPLVQEIGHSEPLIWEMHLSCILSTRKLLKPRPEPQVSPSPDPAVALAGRVFICYQHTLVVTFCETWEYKTCTIMLCAACPEKNMEIVHSLNKCWLFLNIPTVWPWRVSFHHFHPSSRKIQSTLSINTWETMLAKWDQAGNLFT